MTREDMMVRLLQRQRELYSRSESRPEEEKAAYRSAMEREAPFIAAALKIPMPEVQRAIDELQQESRRADGGT